MVNFNIITNITTLRLNSSLQRAYERNLHSYIALITRTYICRYMLYVCVRSRLLYFKHPADEKRLQCIMVLIYGGSVCWRFNREVWFVEGVVIL
jgi:hypothetical protein